MYNKDTKMAFISTLSSAQTRLAATSLFNSTEMFEEKAGQDISAFTARDIQDMQSKIEGGKVYSSRQRDVTLLKNYLEWAYVHHICETNMSRYVLLAADMNANTILFASPSHLQTKLDLVFNTDASDDVDLLSRGFVWMAYMGIPEKETINITSSDMRDYEIDQGKVIVCNDILYKIPAEAYTTFNKLRTLDYLTTLASTGVVRKFNRVQGDVLLRGTTRLGNITVGYLKVRITRKSKVYNLSKSLCYNSLYKSGVFYRQYLLQQQGFIPTFSELMPSHSYVHHNRQIDIYNQNKLKAIHAEYEAWKDKYYSL